jgi:hypothetical protein
MSPRRSRKSHIGGGCSNGSNTFAVGIYGMDNDTLYSMNQCNGAIGAVLMWLRGLAPAAIENGIRSRNTCGGRCILASHDADQDIDCRSGVASRQRADFGQGFGHGNAFSSIRVRRHRSVNVDFAVHYEHHVGIAASPKGASIETSFDAFA